MNTKETSGQIQPTLRDAIRIAIASCKDGYAQAYLREARNLNGKALATQLLYCLSNMGQWRGPEARQVKAVMKNWLHEQGEIHI